MTTENGMGYNMNVVPQGYGYGGNGNDGMFGGNWMWFLLIWFAMFGWGNGGFGGFGNNGGGFVGADIQRGFDQSALTTGINGIQNSLCNGFAGVNQAISNGFAQAEIANNGRQMADMNQNFQLQSALQQCCCENRAATADLKYTMATEAANTRANCDANNQKIMDKLCQLELDGIKQNYENRIAGMQNTIDQLRAQNTRAQSAAAFGALGDRFQASQDAQTAALEQYLAPTPRPAYVVQNPNCCPGNYGFGGCGGYAAA